jgi:hypothetical protein
LKDKVKTSKRCSRVIWQSSIPRGIAKTNWHYSNLVALCILNGLQVWEWLWISISRIHSRGSMYSGLSHSHKMYKQQQQADFFIVGRIK